MVFIRYKIVLVILALLAHSLCSFPHGPVETHKYMFTLKTHLMEMIAIFVVSRNTPSDTGPVSTRDNRSFNRPLSHSLHSFARTTHSTHSLCSATLAPCKGLLTHFAHSLVRQLKFMNMYSR